jgi:hypothetical protein
MTLSALRSELGAIRAHDLTPVNVEAVEYAGAALVLRCEDPDADLVAGLREDMEAAEAGAKAAEDEAAEWERQMNQLESSIECDSALEALADARASEARFRLAATQWAAEVQAMRAEVTALRKRKGVAAGVCAYSQEVWSLLSQIAYEDGRRQTEARRLFDKINSL